MCAGDVTLEDAFTVDSPSGLRGVATKGWGAMHTCADWNAIYDFAKRQRWERV